MSWMETLRLLALSYCFLALHTASAEIYDLSEESLCSTFSNCTIVSVKFNNASAAPTDYEIYKQEVVNGENYHGYVLSHHDEKRLSGLQGNNSFLIPKNECYQFQAYRRTRFEPISGIEVQIDGRSLTPEDLIHLHRGESDKDVVWYAGDCSVPQCNDDEGLFELEIWSNRVRPYFDWFIKKPGALEYVKSCDHVDEYNNGFCQFRQPGIQRERLCLPRDSCYDFVLGSITLYEYLLRESYNAQNFRATFDGILLFEGFLQSQSFSFGGACPDSSRETMSRVEFFYFPRNLLHRTYDEHSFNYKLFHRASPSQEEFIATLVPSNSTGRFYYLALDVPTGSCLKIEPFDCSGNSKILDHGVITLDGVVYADKFFPSRQPWTCTNTPYYVGDCLHHLCREDESVVEVGVSIPGNVTSSFNDNPRNYLPSWKVGHVPVKYRQRVKGRPETERVVFYCVPRDQCQLLEFKKNYWECDYYVLVDGSPVEPLPSDGEEIITRLVNVGCPLLRKEKRRHRLTLSAVLLGGFVVGGSITALASRVMKKRRDQQ